MLVLLGICGVCFGREIGFQLCSQTPCSRSRGIGTGASSSAEEKTHQFPEWKQHEERLKSPAESRIPMRYKDFLENPPQGVDSLESLSTEAQEDLRDQIDELHSIESVWR